MTLIGAFVRFRRDFHLALYVGLIYLSARTGTLLTSYLSRIDDLQFYIDSKTKVCWNVMHEIGNHTCKPPSRAASSTLPPGQRPHNPLASEAGQREPSSLS